MTDKDPRLLLGIGLCLLLLGVILPLLMIMQVLESTFFLNFIAYTSSVVGLIVGIMGAFAFAARNRRK